MEPSETVRSFLNFARRRTDTVAPSITRVKATTFPCEYPVISKYISGKHTTCSSLTAYSTSLPTCKQRSGMFRHGQTKHIP